MNLPLLLLKVIEYDYIYIYSHLVAKYSPELSVTFIKKT